CEMNLEQRRREAQRVRRIIEDETARFARWWRTRQVIPTVMALRTRAEQARQEELAEALAKLEHLSEADQAVVADLSRAIVQKLLHQPTVRLKELAGDQLADGSTLDLAHALFGLSALEKPPSNSGQ
ncbi:MAG TPA: glutamyl-tRNA reductase, partial [Chloroflexota bacterium]|nr:glutamyl-tRNA reductase [Chloroflexota bacterium]